jgi:2-phospho-L-lactate guanylyltransferase
MSTIAVLPVKRFDESKQRLGEVMRSGTRRALTEAMLTDVLTALRRARRVDRVVVVTSENAADALARAHDAVTIRDPAEPGHNPAAAEGVRWAVEQGARRVLLVPGDCPALSPAEVDDLLIAHPGSDRRVTIVPDRHGTGTNALVLCPPDAIAPSFGPGSRARHEEAARAAGAHWRIAKPPSLVLDVDTIEDLGVLRAALDERTGGAAHTRGLLSRLGRR